MNRSSSFALVRHIAVAAVSLFLACAAPLQALQLTVSGITYDITLNLGSYDAVNAGANGPLSATPWFGDISLASCLSTELQAQDTAPGGPVVPDPNAIYGFAVSDFDWRTYNPSSAGGAPTIVTFAGFPTSDTNAPAFFDSAPYYFATGTIVGPAAVPEIDGNALAKALFILFALGAWLDARRRRAQGVSSRIALAD